MSSRSFTVALGGADGAGKTTVARQLERAGSIPLKYLYMGQNPAAKNHMLPTTRMIQGLKRALGRGADQGGPPDPSRRRPPARGLGRLVAGPKAVLRLANQLAEEGYHAALAHHFLRRGFVVLFDRHFYTDYYAHDIAPGPGGLPLTRRIHGYALQRLFSRPDYVILLDAPAEVLFARKGEGTVELIESRRQEYFLLRDRMEHFEVVDATRPSEEVATEVDRLIAGFARSRAPRSHRDGAGSADV